MLLGHFNFMEFLCFISFLLVLFGGFVLHLLSLVHPKRYGTGNAMCLDFFFKKKASRKSLKLPVNYNLK